jgi:hypothetical protein
MSACQRVTRHILTFRHVRALRSLAGQSRQPTVSSSRRTILRLVRLSARPTDAAAGARDRHDLAVNASHFCSPGEITSSPMN